MNEVANKVRLSDFFTQQMQLELCDLYSPPVQLTRYDIDHYSDQLYPAFDIDYPHQYEQWATKRKAQFLAGRLSARESLRAIGITETSIPSGAHREPIWPEGVFGSISHADGFSLSTVMRCEMPSILGIGLDVQTIINNKEAEAIKESILSPRDHELLENKVDGLSDNQLLTLIFSAKESFFKAAYKNVGHYFDFNIVSVKDLDVEYQQMTLVCETTLSDEITTSNEYPVFVDILEIDTPVVITHCIV